MGICDDSHQAHQESWKNCSELEKNTINHWPTYIYLTHFNNFLGPFVRCIVVCFPTLTRGEEGLSVGPLWWAGTLLGPVSCSVDPVHRGGADLGEHCHTLHLLEEDADDSLAGIFSLDQRSPHVPLTRQVLVFSSPFSCFVVVNAQMFPSRNL